MEKVRSDISTRRNWKERDLKLIKKQSKYFIDEQFERDFVGSIPTSANSPQTRSLGLNKQSLPPQALDKSAQADFVRVAANARRRVFFPKWDAPDFVSVW